MPRLLCGGGGKRAWYTLFAHVQSSLGNLHTTPLHLNYSQFLFTCWKTAQPSYTSCGKDTRTGGLKVENNITLTVTVCIAPFKVIGELQREKLRQSCAIAFSWNGRTRGQFLQAKSWIPSLLPHHRLHRVWWVAGLFYTGEVGLPRSSRLVQRSRFHGNFQISGGTEHTQTVYTRLFFSHPRTRDWERG